MKVLVGFIDEHRAEFGVEPICEQLQLAPSSYYAAQKREIEPSRRAVRDARTAPMLEALWVRNRKVYGAALLPILGDVAAYASARVRVLPLAPRLVRHLVIGLRASEPREAPAARVAEALLAWTPD